MPCSFFSDFRDPHTPFTQAWSVGGGGRLVRVCLSQPLPPGGCGGFRCFCLVGARGCAGPLPTTHVSYTDALAGACPAQMPVAPRGTAMCGNTLRPNGWANLCGRLFMSYHAVLSSASAVSLRMVLHSFFFLPATARDTAHDAATPKQDAGYPDSPEVYRTRRCKLLHLLFCH